MLRNVELRKLPAGTLSAIVDILEINDDWKRVMSIIPKDPNGDRSAPKYNIEHIRLIEEYANATHQKCAEILFDEWGTSGRVRPTLRDLRDVAVAAGAYRAADEIALLLQEPPPLRPAGGPEQQITTNVTEILNQSMQHQISTAQAKDYNNKNEYQNQITEPIHTAYFGIESVNTADLPNISDLKATINSKSTAQIEPVSDFMKFTQEQSLLQPSKPNSTGELQEIKSIASSTFTENQQNNVSNDPQCPPQSLKPSSNVDLDSVISQDTNLIDFRYYDLEVITNYFCEDPPNKAHPKSTGKIGCGGFGDVFLGYHPKLGTLAIKRANQNQSRCYKPEIVSKVFNSEVKFLSKFRHRNIVPILGYSVDGPAPCIVCEYISGGSLLQKISEKVLNENQRINIMLGAAEGLKYLHTSNRHIHSKPSEGPSLETNLDWRKSANNSMHGDVKSANILLTEDYEPKLCDFGLAKQYEATWEISSPMGTSAYMAPEGLYGTITQKLDIYSYGIVLLELLTGQKPIVDQNGEKLNIKLYVYETCKDNDITGLLDPATHWTRAEEVFSLAGMCLENDRHRRPTMAAICDVLNNIKNK